MINKRRVILVRHGQSDSNAGKPSTTAYSEIPLTEKGHQQAQNFASSFNEKPNLILCSPYLRAIQTSEPFRNKYSDVGFEIDQNIKEFSYIDPEFCKGTTVTDRKKRVDDFWNKMDPKFYDSDSVECFSDLVSRAKSFLKSIQQRKENLIVAFTHALFMIIVEIIINNPDRSDLDLFKIFSEDRNTKHIPNCGVVEIDPQDVKF